MNNQEFLAMSLPYDLKMIHGRGDIITLDELYVLDDGIIAINSKLCSSLFKPILHPLSDLTKEIEHKGERFVPIDILDGRGSSFYGGVELRQMLFEGDYSIHAIPYATFKKLIEWHFDIADLISKGEAIDVNELKFNPYK